MPNETRDRFDGIPQELFTFLEGLETDNSKEYWNAHSTVYKDKVKATAEALVAELEPRFGTLRTFRPNRDVRFSKDKSPYKTWVGITTTDRAVGGVGSFLQIDSAGITVATGAMMLAKDQLDKFRSALAGAPGDEFEQLRSDLSKQGLEIGPGEFEPYKRIPSAYPKDHPRADLLRWKGAIITKRHNRAKWMHTAKVLDRIYDVWSDGEPLVEWLDNNVGASETTTRRP